MNIIRVEVECTREKFWSRPSARIRVDCFQDLDTGKVCVQGGEGYFPFVDGKADHFSWYRDAVILGEIEDYGCREDRVLYIIE